MTTVKLSSFPKITAIGSRFCETIFDEPVEITEKVDGSQFVFGVTKEGELLMRSKGAVIYAESQPKMFDAACAYVSYLHQANRIVQGVVFYGEYLNKPKHNVLTYGRVPMNNIMLFGAIDMQPGGQCFPFSSLKEMAADMELETVPVLYEGMANANKVIELVANTESVLGNVKVEGVVVKNYKDCNIGGAIYPVMAGKYVSEAFKEIHHGTWSKEHTAGGKWEAFKQGFKAEARWLKAIQHLQEKGELELEPRDIGKLLKEIHDDIMAEEQERISKFLMREFGSQVIRTAQAGFPEFYKQWLMHRTDGE